MPEIGANDVKSCCDIFSICFRKSKVYSVKAYFPNRSRSSLVGYCIWGLQIRLPSSPFNPSPKPLFQPLVSGELNVESLHYGWNILLAVLSKFALVLFVLHMRKSSFIYMGYNPRVKWHLKKWELQASLRDSNGVAVIGAKSTSANAESANP